MELSLNINPSDPITIFIFIFLGLGGQLWVAWFVRQMQLDDEAPALANLRVSRLLIAAVNVIWGFCYLYWIGLGIAYFTSGLIATPGGEISDSLQILGIGIQSIAIMIWGIKYTRRSRVDIPKVWTWISKEHKDIWVSGFSILVDEIHLLLGFGYIVSSLGLISSGADYKGFSAALLGTQLVISGYIVIKFGKTFETGISWSCVVFGIGIVAQFLLAAIYREISELSAFDLSIGVLDVTHGLIGAGILVYKKLRNYLRMVAGEFVAIWALGAFGTSIVILDTVMFALSIGIFCLALGLIVGGKWLYVGGVFWGIGLLPVGIEELSKSPVSLFLAIALICMAILMFVRENFVENEREKLIQEAYQEYVKKQNRIEQKRATRRSKKSRGKK